MFPVGFPRDKFFQFAVYACFCFKILCLRKQQTRQSTALQPVTIPVELVEKSFQKIEGFNNSWVLVSQSVILIN